MSGSKLEYLLDKFPADKYRLFRTELAQGQRKRDRTLLELLDMVYEGISEGPALYAVLYPGKPYSEKQIRNLRSDLLNRLIHFLTHDHLDESPELGLYKIRALLGIGATKYAQNLVDKELKKIDQGPLGISEMGLRNDIEEEALPLKLSNRGRRATTFSDQMKGQEECFIAQTLSFALAEQEAALTIHAQPALPQIALWNSLVDLLEQGAWQESKVIQIYYQALRIGRNPIPKVVRTFIHALIQHAPQLAENDILILYRVAMNHCTRMLNQGIQEILVDKFSLHKKMVDLGLFWSADAFSPWHFYAIVNCAIQLEAFDWARQFIESHALLLPAKNQQDMQYYSLGLIAYGTRSFQEAEGWMHRSMEQNEDLFIHLDLRTYLLRIYFETENLVGMESMLESFRLLLQRHKHLSTNRLSFYKDFLRCFRRLIALKPGQPQQALAIYQLIQNHPHGMARNWLEEKIQMHLPRRNPGTSEEAPGKDC